MMSGESSSAWLTSGPTRPSWSSRPTGTPEGTEPQHPEPVQLNLAIAIFAEIQMWPHLPTAICMDFNMLLASAPMFPAAFSHASWHDL
eukprot:8052750-Alexandrium_andersonii.AAC.1